jgi:hypothetical protein
VAAARGRATTAAHAASHARAALQRREDELAEAALIEYAERLDAAMLETIQRLGDVGRRLRRMRAVWGPSRPLADMLRRAQADLGTL